MVSNRDRPVTIFVPPGATPLVSAGVQVQPMTSPPPQPDRTKAAPPVDAKQVSTPGTDTPAHPRSKEPPLRPAIAPPPGPSGDRVAADRVRSERGGANQARSERPVGNQAHTEKPVGNQARSVEPVASRGRRGRAGRAQQPPERQAAPARMPAAPTPEEANRPVIRWARLPNDSFQIPQTWDHMLTAPEGGATAMDDTFVPPEVEAAGREVMALYDMQVSDMRLITAKPDKGGAIWRIETSRGPRSLKLLHRQSARSLFSVGAQDYLVKQGARVPALVPTRNGELSVERDGKQWIVTDWITELVPATKIDLEGTAALCYGLGEFHRHSKGYVPPLGAYNASRLYRWPKAYRKVLAKMDWFRQIARAYSEMPASSTILSMVDMFEQQARDAIARLDASPYASLVARGEQEWGLVHQDYGFSNGQMGPGGIWLIDLDGVAFDLGIRDLRKLITSTMDDMGVWDLTWMRAMIDAYNQANPIEPELMQVLLIDMSLPNEFYKHVKAGITKNNIG